jgi:hypothetical protein
MTAGTTGGAAEPALRALTERLATAGARYPALAAALLVARGREALDRPALAATLGIPVEHLRSIESGRRPAAHVPHRLVELAADLDWAAAGVLPRDHPADLAARHPSRWPRAGATTPARIRPWERSGSSTA